MPAKISREVRETQISAISGISFKRWDGEYRNSNSRAFVACEFGHEWSVNINGLINGGNRCKECQSKRLSEVKRADESCVIGKIVNRKMVSFVRWDCGYRNQKSIAVVNCLVCGHEFKSSVTNLTDSKNGCPKCSGKYKWTPEERITQINKINSISFVRWESEYKNCRSKAIVSCSLCGNEWGAQVISLISAGRRCPSCSKTGFNPSIGASLYVLRSACGKLMKIGISNNHKKRLAKLSKSTPFDFVLVDLVCGNGALISNLEVAIHSITDECEFGFKFDGFTEWRKWDSKIHEWIDFIKNNAAIVEKMSKDDISSLLISMR